MRHRLLLTTTAVAALLSLAACSETTTEPRRFDPGTLRKGDVLPDPDGTCRSGYVIATRSDGTVVCEPE
jgi:hypothetical protein